METNINSQLIQQYLQGKLSHEDMYILEKQAIDDPFLADAIEGYRHSKGSVNGHLSILQRQLGARVAEKEVTKNANYFTWQRLSIAAAGGLLFILAGILFWMHYSKSVIGVSASKATIEIIFPSQQNTSGILGTSCIGTSKALPALGAKNYQEYVEQNLRIPKNQTGINGKVVVQFKVSPTGKIESAQILQSLTPDLDKEVLRLIETGPDWKPKSATGMLEINIK